MRKLRESKSDKINERQREREPEMGREDDREREREKGRVTAGHHCSRWGGQWCPRRQDTIRAGRIVNGVLDDAIMDEPWSKSESARERERAREERRVKDSPEAEREEDRE